MIDKNVTVFNNEVITWGIKKSQKLQSVVLESVIFNYFESIVRP